MTNRLRQITAALATILLASCGAGVGEDPAPDTTVASVTVTGATNVAPGSTIQLAAAAKNAAGTTLPGLATSWSSSATAVATVNASGLVTGVANGAATITATISGKTGTRAVTVQQINISASATVAADASNSFTPQQVDISTGGSVTWTFSGSEAHNVSFAGTTGAPASIGDTQNQSVSRTFATAGTFNYNCTRHAGMTGVVVVH
jgi:trimeric autotransporter adhesin